MFNFLMFGSMCRRSYHLFALTVTLPNLSLVLKDDRLWQQLANALNSIGSGVHKTPDKWKKSNEQSTSGLQAEGGGRERGSGRGRGRGRGKGKSADPDNLLQMIRAERQITQKHIAGLPDYQERKRVAELQRVLLPDAPPRKRRTQKPSPEREECDFIPQLLTSASRLLSPQPSTSTSRLPSPQPSTSTSRLPSPQPSTSMPTLQLDSCIDTLELSPQPSTSAPKLSSPLEDRLIVVPVEVSTITRFKTVCDWLNSDSDLDNYNEPDDEVYPTATTRQMETTTDDDFTPHQLQIIQAEDRANDRAIQDLLPNDCFTFDWTKDKSTFKAKRETFTGIPGPTFDVTDTTPIDIFEKMFDVEFIDSLCDETNRYARQKLDSIKDKTTPTSRFHRWTPTDRQEMIRSLALMLLQGLYPLPSEESYFSFNGFGTMPNFNQIMTYNRHLLLKSMLHFVDNNTDLPTKTRLFKIQPILDYFNRKFASLYYPQQEIVVDESLLKWHGRLSFAQKINTKVAQVGVKSYELCESSTGYLWKFMVYAGKSKTTINTDNNDNDDDNNIEQTEQDDRTEQTLSDFQPTNATAKIVFDLVQPLLHKGHTLIMDNFYNCPLLARCLKLRQTDSYGTQRLNREFIPASLRTISKTDLRHGELVATY
ncbi:unnamed protein product [Euphydryas editha]|uniref:PiggyBac transposable element-derived protein domain-containing protein n=1 Tax=Euphydryas editha TaxID=104508 RepID=A0AAU9TVV5_EUPED|nr:unnamed protein product [Euphydryas editha]